MSEFKVQRLDFSVEPETGNSHEVEGVCNPAAARGPDGELYLFPRLVAAGNYSRVGIMRVLFDRDGNPSDVERLGVALEPETNYELRANGAGGCEDPRVSYVVPLGLYVMTYTAFSPAGPRIALATSKDLLTWQRAGLATFDPYEGVDFNGIDNKDGVVFPVAIANPSDQMELAMLHRPLFDGSRPEETVERGDDREIDLQRESVWISYGAMDLSSRHPYQPGRFTSHHRLASPKFAWEVLKIGSGAPPVLTRHGWLLVYHGVSDASLPDDDHRLTYRAGVMVLTKKDPQHLLYRSATPLLSPTGVARGPSSAAHVVFPTGLDRRDDIGQPDRLDLYYGVDDFTIGVARLDVPRELPSLDDGDLATTARDRTT